MFMLCDCFKLFIIAKLSLTKHKQNRTFIETGWIFKKLLKVFKSFQHNEPISMCGGILMLNVVL